MYSVGKFNGDNSVVVPTCLKRKSTVSNKDNNHVEHDRERNCSGHANLRSFSSNKRVKFHHPLVTQTLQSDCNEQVKDE